LPLMSPVPAFSRDGQPAAVASSSGLHLRPAAVAAAAAGAAASSPDSCGIHKNLARRMTIRFFIPKARLARKAAKVRKPATHGDTAQQLVAAAFVVAAADASGAKVLLLKMQLVCE